MLTQKNTCLNPENRIPFPVKKVVVTPIPKRLITLLPTLKSIAFFPSKKIKEKKDVCAPLENKIKEAIATFQSNRLNSSLSMSNSSVIMASIAVSWPSNALYTSFYASTTFIPLS
nr:hypothetical protein [Flavobacterium sp. ACAM 123]